MTTAIVDQLERAKADIIGGRVEVPTLPDGPTLDLDPVPAGLEEAVAPYSAKELTGYTSWLAQNYRAEFGQRCFEHGTRATCGQMLLDHLEDWRTRQ
jgi:hypothetical protein